MHSDNKQTFWGSLILRSERVATIGQANITLALECYNSVNIT